jgi:hypothetical protein
LGMRRRKLLIWEIWGGVVWFEVRWGRWQAGQVGWRECV